MLSVIPAGLFSRLRIFLGRLKPHALPVARRHIVLGSIGAGTGLAVTSAKRSRLAPELPTVGELGLSGFAQIGHSRVTPRYLRWERFLPPPEPKAAPTQGWTQGAF